MNAMISDRTERKMTAYDSSGIAKYVFESDEAPAWLVASVPGAAEAREAWLAANERGRELTRAKRATEKAAPATKLTKIQNGVGVTAGPAHGVTYAEWESGQFAIREAENAVAAQARRSLAALKKYDGAVYGNTLTADELRQCAAEHALKKHEEAVVAWEALKAILGERDAARNAAGRPGAHWATRSKAVTGELGSEAKSERILDARIESFDVEAVRLASTGEKVMSAAEILAAETKALEDAFKAGAVAARKRGRAQGFN
ncbi:hypothetical protein J7E83_05715 [Arthrobacter sp. ISL-48]|uniref:hypothetical protein n=1 Tax=Arthrobacter sp. ISL-48 TaxID=2819110 RepID=UPI001BEAB098|nr:hypothetical protein [Arthrobacter sp. ISL-48]MBT2531625.1 hypothetical protein [Arthrobacter sp. ISL-48]